MSSRKEFEEWYWNEFGQFEDDGWMQCFAIEEGDYYRLGARMSWAAWQASRQALEIALPVLEQQEKKQDVSLREGLAALSDHIDSIGGYNFEALEAYRREEFGRQEKGNDDWVEWKGGECPVADGLAVTEVKFRSGDVVKAFADTWWWGHSGDEDDIIAYRVVEQERERGEEE